MPRMFRHATGQGGASAKGDRPLRAGSSDAHEQFTLNDRAAWLVFRARRYRVRR
jgi:hypothetical protein